MTDPTGPCHGYTGDGLRSTGSGQVRNVVHKMTERTYHGPVLTQLFISLVLALVLMSRLRLVRIYGLPA